MTKTEYYRLQRTNTGYKRVRVTRKATNAKKYSVSQFLSRSIGLWLLIGVMSCGYVVATYSVPTSSSAHGNSTLSEKPRVATESAKSNTSTRSAQIQEASVSAKIVKDESYYINEAVEKYLPKHKSEALMIMHCLANRESQHGTNKGYGDNGKAGGPFQFWQDTWLRMRGQMIKQGHITEVGDRHDFRQSAHTTAWALSQGRAKEWGPILRMAQGKSNAVCPVPSWSK